MRSLEGRERQAIQLAALSLALADQRADSTVGFAEGCSLLYEIISEIRRHHAARERCPHTLHVEPCFLERAGNCRKYQKSGVDCIEQHPLVILEVLVVS